MKTSNQLGEELCNYCEYKDNRYVSYFSGGCEGGFCDEAYQNYIEENNLENELILEDLENGK